MKIIIEDIGPDEEEAVIIRCREVDEAVMQLVNGLKLKKEKLTVRQGEKILQIEPGDIYYFEAVDNKVFLYLEKNVYETKLKLYELERRFAGTDFFRVSKSVILNLNMILFRYFHITKFILWNHVQSIIHHDQSLSITLA